MPHAAPSDAAPDPPDQTSPPPGNSGPEPQPANTVPKPDAHGALFRALVDAGAGAEVAYTADQSMQSAVSAGVTTELQPFLLEVRQFVAESQRWRAESERWRAESERRLAESERRLEALEGQIAESNRRWDALAAELTRTNELVAVKLDAIKRELRLIWGALGISLTVWLAVLGYLLAG